MKQGFPNLLSEYAIGTCVIANRIVSTGHHTHLAHGVPNKDLIAYHEARAKGGAGLIISEIVAVHETAGFSGNLLQIKGPEDVPAYRALVEACHRHGAKVFAQLFHPGREILNTQDGMLPVAYAPSAVPNERFHIMPKPMSVPLIKDIIAGYAQTAVWLAEAGFDGFEIVANQGYLPAQFLSSKVNLRDDDYGGDFTRRLRFTQDVISEIRAACPDQVLGLRISGSELDDTGMDNEEILKICTVLGSRLDYLSVVAGTSATLGASVHITPPMGIEHGYTAPYARVIRAATDLPVIATGRINQPQMAEAIIADGDADFCGMTRAMICDPEMPTKTLTGNTDNIRACIGCNQACIGRAHKGLGVSCIQHPESGRELTYAQLVPAKSRKRVLVIGGGPAGMKAAAVGAARGHDVTLCEKDTHLGGQARLAQCLPGREEFGGIIDNLKREMDAVGVSIKTGSKMTVDRIVDQSPNEVILATGARPYTLEFEGHDLAGIVSAWDVLAGKASLDANVAIADWRADWIGIGLAEMLAKEGLNVTLCTNAAQIGETLQMYTRNHYLGRLYRLGINMHTHVRVFGFDGETGYFQNTLTGEPVVIEPLDNLVLALGHKAHNDLEAGLENTGIPVHRIGDCVAPRTAEEAVFEGLKVGWTI